MKTLILSLVTMALLGVARAGEMSAWELFWWNGGSDYPSRWWHGLGPSASMGASVAFAIIVSWYLLRRLFAKR
jgi:hypothetical protein